MKLTTLLPLAVTATGLVLPDAQVFEQIVEKDGQTNRHHHAAAASWWENLPSKDEVISKTEATMASHVESHGPGKWDAVNEASAAFKAEHEATFWSSIKTYRWAVMWSSMTFSIMDLVRPYVLVGPIGQCSGMGIMLGKRVASP